MEQDLQSTEEQATMFGVLADPTRLKLLKLLSRQGKPHAVCVNALAALLGVTQSAVSQHLRVLRAAGLVKGQRRGYHVHYFVNRDALEHYRELLLSALTTEQPVKEESYPQFCPERRQKDVSPV